MGCTTAGVQPNTFFKPDAPHCTYIFLIFWIEGTGRRFTFKCERHIWNGNELHYLIASVWWPRSQSPPRRAPGNCRRRHCWTLPPLRPPSAPEPVPTPDTWRVFNSHISDLNLRFGILICKLKCILGAQMRRTVLPNFKSILNTSKWRWLSNYT